ncbi:hypothetical protein AMTRI_Chr09g18360 [Amborella trichopoda]
MASPRSFTQLFSGHPPFPLPPLSFPLGLPPCCHVGLLNSLVGYFSPPRFDLRAMEKWAQRSWNDPNNGCCFLQRGGILFSFPSREGSEMALCSPPLAFKGATLTISRWNPSVRAFLPCRIWLRAFNIPPMCATRELTRLLVKQLGASSALIGNLWNSYPLGRYNCSLILFRWSLSLRRFGLTTMACTSGLAWPGSRLRRLPNSTSKLPIARHALETLVPLQCFKMRDVAKSGGGVDAAMRLRCWCITTMRLINVKEF